MIARPLDLASRLRPPPHGTGALHYVNVGLLGLFFALFGSRFILAPEAPEGETQPTDTLSLQNMLAAVGTSAHQPKRELSVLLAEDNVVNQKLAVRLIEKRGHSVVAVNNGREAVDRVEREHFDLVLMDISMPEMDGLEATALIRSKLIRSKHPTEGRLPIIAMTGHALIGDREMCLRAGMDGYVSKPIRADDLFLVIDEVLAGAAALQLKLPAHAEGTPGHPGDNCRAKEARSYSP